MKILKFNAIWCPGCLIMRPRWNKVINELPEIEITEYDYDSNREEVDLWNIGNKLPVAIIVDDKGSELTRIIGEKSFDDLLKIINELMVK